jgi:hypothetical protein
MKNTDAELNRMMIQVQFQKYMSLSYFRLWLQVHETDTAAVGYYMHFEL